MQGQLSARAPSSLVRGGAGRAVKPMAIFGLRLPGAATGTRVQEAKEELLEAIAPLKRGLTATPEQRQEVERLASRLERVNPTKQPLASDLVNGEWELLYTTSESILGTSKPALLRPSGPIYQVIDAEALTARNRETAPLYNQVFAELQPESASRVRVQFKEFKLLGLLPVKAPPSAVGRLDITFLDEELRVSRGDKGNLFVLRMHRRGVKP